MPNDLRTSDLPPRDRLDEPIRAYAPEPPEPAWSDPPERALAWVRSESPLYARFVWLLLLAGCVTLIATAWGLKPDPRGHSTHEQLRLPPCGFYLTSGLPCPTCGATTAFAWTIQGHPWMGLKTHPFGAVAAVATVALLAASAAGIVTAGVPAIRMSRRSSHWVVLGFMGLLVGSWIYKLLLALIAHP